MMAMSNAERQRLYRERKKAKKVILTVPKSTFLGVEIGGADFDCLMYQPTVFLNGKEVDFNLFSKFLKEKK